MLTKKQLAITLSKLKTFENPNIKLEQYPSDSEMLAEILWQAHLFNHIENKIILDPGCGTGLIGIGAKLLGAKKVICLDIDENAIKIAQQNTKSLNLKIEFIKQNYLEYNFNSNKKINTIIENPPFGTRQKHIDKKFLLKSIQNAENIYSIHKKSTKEYLEKLLSKNQTEIFYELDFSYPLKNSYKQHKSKIKRIETICLGIKTK